MQSMIVMGIGGAVAAGGLALIYWTDRKRRQRDGRHRRDRS